MKIITILSLCLTASLSFAHSEILDKTNGDAFTYDDSVLYTNMPAYQTINNNLPKILKKETISKRIKTTATIHNVSRDKLDFITIGIDNKPIWSSHGEIEDSSYQRYFSLGFGFSSEASANAFFNIHILNNTPNNQLGYLRWLTYEFSDSIKSYMINLGATTTEHLVPPLFPLYKTPNDTTDNTFTYKYLWLCNNVISCQFIKLSDMCDTSPKPQTPLRFPYGSYYSPEKINLDCEVFLSFQRALPGFSSEVDANINIQLFDSPVLLKDKQNHPTKIKHDF